MSKPITDEDIRELGLEAEAAGDTEQITLCRDALAGDESARRECERVIEGVRNWSDRISNRAAEINSRTADTDALAEAFADGEEVFILIRHLREGLQPLVRDGLIDGDRAYERARNTAAIVLGTFKVSIHHGLSREDVAELPVSDENPFASTILRGNYGAANELKKLVVNLFNNTAKPDMAAIMLRDRQHRELAMAMLSHYAEHGERCPVFMAVARELA